MIDPPKYEETRRAHFDRELRERAKVWLPEWQPRNRDADLAGAVFSIAARLAGEVTQRLSRVPEKNFRGLLHWLGIRGEAGRAARVPVVFQMTAGADAVSADRGVQVQAAGLAEPVVFETTEPMTVTPSVVTSLFAGDPAVDAYYVAPPGLLSLDLPQGQQNSWGVLASAPVGSRKLQLDPPGGLAPGLVLETEEQPPRQFTVLAVADGLCDIDPAIGDERDAETGGFKRTGPPLAANTRLKRVTAFAPFDGTTRDAQQHAVYVGAKKAFEIEAAAVISLSGWEGLDAGYQWSFWGKVDDADKPGWVGMQWMLTQQKKKVLLKPKGKVEETEVNKIKSRWLRGLRKSLLGEPEPEPLVPLKVFINCDPDESSQPVEIEGVANASPLVLNTAFYPLGREPRLFDAFYLGSREAFSKPRARVTARFTFGDDWSSPPAAATNTLAGTTNPRHVLFAIGTDNALRVVEVTEVNNASTIKFHSPPQPPDGAGRFVKLHAEARPGVCHQGVTTYASAFAGKDVWLWSSRDDKFPEGAWESLGKPADPRIPDGDTYETLLTRNGADNALYVYVLIQGQLFRRESAAGAAWQTLPVEISGVPIKLLKIAPLVDMDAAAGTPRDQDGLLGVDADGRLYLRDGANSWSDITPAGYPADSQIYPLFVELPGSASRRVIFAVKTRQQDPVLHMLVQLDPAAGPGSIEQSEDVRLQGTAIEVFTRGTSVVAVFTLLNAGVACPAQWDPTSAVNPRVVPIDLPPGPGELTQGPARAGARLMFPGSRGTLRVMNFDASAHDEIPNAAVLSAALLESSANLIAGDKYRVDITPTVPEEKKVAAVVKEVAMQQGDGFALILDDAGVTTPDRAAITLYRDMDLALFNSTIDGQNRLERLVGDAHTDVGVMVFITWDDAGVAHERVLRVTARSGNLMSFGVQFPAAASNVQYVAVEKISDLNATLRPALDVDKKFGAFNATFTFPDLEPVRQKVLISSPDQGTNRWVILREAWDVAPTGPVKMSADALNVKLDDGQPPRGNNPLLSWEYWDGSSWWRIPNLVDGTDRFAMSGDVEFCVPGNVAETEVAGRKNFWIRARLVGGDYGQESVKLETDSTGKVQTVTRSTENIRAPLVNEAQVTYELCCPVTPDHVLAEDTGDFVNHSAVNAEPDAKIRAFVPLSAAGRERAVYVGFDAPPGAQSMSLLFVLEERPHSDAYPLRAEMRRANQFEPIDCQDGTRGLSETGLVKLEFEAPPLKVSLFGRSQHWVRLLPRVGFEPDKWQPEILGVYANAAIAAAHETQRNELLGSSDGRPGLQVTLARTPVVKDSLVLRVRERLSDEEVEELRKSGKTKVLATLAEREGPWVLWEECSDLLSSKPGERVFTFADDTGDITFGDGLHGMIPPVGRDCIVAESYQRGGGEVANQVTRRTQASLITPLQGVERAAFAGDAAGGSNPDDSARTLRFAPNRLSCRRRLLTLADLERAALEFSVDVAQAFARRADGGVELFVVMRGADPLPSAAVRRSLTSFLAKSTSPGLAVTGAVRVERPTIQTIKIEVKVRVADLADADQVRNDCKQRIATLLDPKDGGFDQQGWRLGVVPDQTDIAARIEDVKNIAELISVRVEAARTSATHLVRLAHDGLRIEIDLVQGAAA